MHFTKDELSRNWPWLIGFSLSLIVLWLLSPILLPFVLGAGLAYLGDPIVDRLQTWKLSRTAGVTVVFVVLTLFGLVATLLIAPMLYKQFLTLLKALPEAVNWVQQTALPKLGLEVAEDMRLDAAALKKVVAENWQEAGSLAKTLWASVSKSSGVLLTLTANLLLIPVVTFYLLRDWDDLVAWVENILPRDNLPTVRRLARETDEVLGAFLRGQMSVMAVLSVFYTVGLWVVGLDLALLVGLGAGMVSFVPYLGFVFGIVIAVGSMLVQTQELLPLIAVVGVFGAGQILESSVLTPLLVGDRIGLHPVAVIFAVMAGGQLFGFIGVLMALPAAAALAVLLRYAKSEWLKTDWYQGTDTEADSDPTAGPVEMPSEDTANP